VRDKAVVDAVLENPETADIGVPLRAMLRFIGKLGRTPAEITADDARAVLAAGVTREMYVDALAVQAAFHHITRCADAFGFEIPDEGGFQASAKSLIKFGYKL